MLYPQTIEELEHVLIVDFRFDRGHDYFIRDGKIALGIDEANIPTLKRRIGDQWEVRVLRRVEHTQDYVFCRVDIVPKEG